MRRPSTNNSIMNVSRSILRFYDLYHGSDTVKVLDRALDDTVNHVVYMLLDGFGVNIIKAHLPKDAFLRRYLRQTITSVFPSTTTAATTAVLSAKPPIETGYIGWMQYFNDLRSHVIVFKNTDYYTNLPASVDVRSTYLPYQTITDQIRHRHPDVKTTVLFPDFVEHGYKTFDDMLFALDVILDTNEKSMSYAYWTEPDLSEHEHGIHHPKIRDLVFELNKKVETFAQTMPPGALLVLIADHGLIDVVPDPLYDDDILMSTLKRQPSLESRACVFDVKEDDKKAFVAHFKKHYGKHYVLKSSRKAIEEGLFGKGPIHPLASSFLGDYIAIATKDHMLSLTKGFPFKAHHAGLTKGELEVPLVIFRKHVHSEVPK